jgi:putative oxidoreductase
MELVNSRRDDVLSLFRVVIGLLFACHGARSLFGAFGKEPVSFGVWPGWWAAVIELVGGVAVLVGVATRIVAVLCSGTMAYAYFVVHQPKELWPIENGGELAAMFCWSFLLIAFFGPGKYALSGLLRRSRQQETSSVG